jgi:hypothetical protein
MNYLYVVGAVIAFIIVLCAFVARTCERTLMTGFWKANIDFCKSADLEMFMLYLGDNVSYVSDTRYGYIVAKTEEGIILNNPIKISLGNNFCLRPWFKPCKKYNASIDWQETEHIEENFPSEVSVAYYPKHQKLVFYTNDNVHAILYKDNTLSEIDADVETLPAECVSETDNQAEEI